MELKDRDMGMILGAFVSVMTNEQLERVNRILSEMNIQMELNGAC